jgi:hypothetical protein
MPREDTNDNSSSPGFLHHRWKKNNFAKITKDDAERFSPQMGA